MANSVVYAYINFATLQSQIFFQKMDKNLSVSQLDPISAGKYTGVGEAFLPWLGAMPTLGRVDPNEDRNVTVWDMPAAYVGKNVVLRDTIEDLGLTAHQTFVTTYILPRISFFF